MPVSTTLMSALNFMGNIPTSRINKYFAHIVIILIVFLLIIFIVTEFTIIRIIFWYETDFIIRSKEDDIEKTKWLNDHIGKYNYVILPLSSKKENSEKVSFLHLKAFIRFRKKNDRLLYLLTWRNSD